MPRAWVVLAAGVGLWVSCGYVGDPLPPALHIPQRITDLKASQKGDRIVIRFTIPALTTEGLGLRAVKEVELRAAPVEAGADPGGWGESGERIAAPAAGPGEVNVERAVSGWAGRRLRLAVRVASQTGRWSEWSPAVLVDCVAVVERPREVRAEAHPQGVVVRWRAEAREGLEFEVARGTGGGREAEVVARVRETEWIDTAAEYGATYTYRVEGVVATGAAAARSEPSESVTITPEDRFAPATPQGLSGVAGIGSIELVWDRSTEPDVAGYFLYRAAGEGGFERLGEIVITPSFSDRQIQSGIAYRYQVSSVDRSGNESARSEAITIAAP